MLLKEEFGEVYKWWFRKRDLDSRNPLRILCASNALDQDGHMQNEQPMGILQMINCVDLIYEVLQEVKQSLLSSFLHEYVSYSAAKHSRDTCTHP